VASKKQRRRREKLQRHEYEYVLETEEGEQVVESRREAEAAAPANGKPTKVPAGPLDRHGKPIQKPSLQRVLKRTAIFGPLIALFIVFTSRDLTYVQVAFNVVFLLAFFMPLTYVVDLFVYRTLWRRYEKDRAAKRAGQARG
jgi:hypothetical protein